MKKGRRVSLLVALLVSTILFSTMVDAQRRRPRFRGDYPRQQQFRGGHGGGGYAGAPIDGGLLALLAGAGVVYFTARKKKKSKE